MNILDQLYEKARLNPQKVAFPEATNEKMMQAAYETGRDGYIHPVLGEMPRKSRRWQSSVATT